MHNRIDASELKRIQLEIMDEIDLFCRENGFNYYINYGTLLGAVRHQGYIPWDDDIDITMPRDDYDRFIEAFNKNRNDTFKVVSAENDPAYYLPFAKVIDTSTIMIENAEVDYEIGVYVDLFPLDRFQKDSLLFRLKKKKISILANMMTLKIISVDKNRSFSKNIVLKIAHTLLDPIPMRKLIKRTDALCQSYRNKKHYDRLGFLPVQINMDKSIWDADLFRETVQLPFEGRMYNAPAGYDGVLKKTYGDYMTLPPLEQRESHHSFVAYHK